MPETGRSRMSIWVEPEDRNGSRYIAERVGLGTESGAIRFAVRRVERMMRADEAERSAAQRRGRGEVMTTVVRVDDPCGWDVYIGRARPLPTSQGIGMGESVRHGRRGRNARRVIRSTARTCSQTRSCAEQPRIAQQTPGLLVCPTR